MEQQLQKWNSNKRNGSKWNSSKETKSREVNTSNPWHTLTYKGKAIVYTSLQLNQMEQQIIKDRKRQSYIYQMEQQIIKDRKRQSYVHDLQ